MNKKILLIAFKYPPYAGVGGFRWSKLSKYLAEIGYTIHVVTVDWKQYGDNTYLEDVIHPNIIIHRIPSLYPHNLKYKPFKKNLIGQFKRILRHLFFKLVNIFWYEDEAQYWGYSLLPFCEQLIKKEDIKNVIATGHPFMANYWAAKLKQKNHEINLIQDFRDEWNDDPNRSLLCKYFEKISYNHEIFVLNNCDVLITVTNGLMELFSKKITANVSKAVIPNGYDFEINPKNNQKRDFRLLYAGSLWAGREEPLEAFLKVLENVAPNIPELRAEFYGSFPDFLKINYAHLFEKGIISHSLPVSHEKISKLMENSFACLLFNARMYPWARSTKIYEHASLRRPTFCINYGGELNELISRYNLGISVNGDDTEQIEKGIMNLYALWNQDPSYEISPDGIEKFHYHNLARDVAKYLK